MPLEDKNFTPTSYLNLNLIPKQPQVQALALTPSSRQDNNCSKNVFTLQVCDSDWSSQREMFENTLVLRARIFPDRLAPSHPTVCLSCPRHHSHSTSPGGVDFGTRPRTHSPTYTSACSYCMCVHLRNTSQMCRHIHREG